MDKLKALLLFLIPFLGYSQQLPEGRWYFLNKKDIGILEITNDSLTNYESTKFEVNASDKLTNGVGFAILTRDYKDGIHTIILKPYQTKVTIQNYMPKGSYIYVTIDHNPIDNFTGVKNKFVTLEELNSYKTLKGIVEMTEKDFIELATFGISLRKTLSSQFAKAGMPFPDYHFYSEIKYKIAELGYNPLIPLKELDKKFQEFRSDPDTKDLYNQFMTKSASDWLEVGVETEVDIEIDKN